MGSRFTPNETGPEAHVAYEAARLRWAQPGDAGALAALWREARDEEDGNDRRMRDWLEHGGALMLEGTDGRLLCALRWREEPGGWRVDRIATVPDARGQGYGRWLMTKVEALAIRYNVARLSLDLDRADLLPYYERLGYRRNEESEGTDDAPPIAMHKRVGGTWQVQDAGRARRP